MINAKPCCRHAASGNCSYLGSYTHGWRLKHETMFQPIGAIGLRKTMWFVHRGLSAEAVTSQGLTLHVRHLSACCPQFLEGSTCALAKSRRRHELMLLLLFSVLLCGFQVCRHTQLCARNATRMHQRQAQVPADARQNF